MFPSNWGRMKIVVTALSCLSCGVLELKSLICSSVKWEQMLYSGGPKYLLTSASVWGWVHLLSLQLWDLCAFYFGFSHKLTLYLHWTEAYNSTWAWDKFLRKARSCLVGYREHVPGGLLGWICLVGHLPFGVRGFFPPLNQEADFKWFWCRSTLEM